MHIDSVISEGMPIRKGEMIDLVLGSESSRTSRIPDLIGMKLDNGKDIITDYFLNIGALTYGDSIETAEDSMAAFIWRQYPEYDEFKRIRMGSEVDLWLSVDSTLLPQPDTLEMEMEP